MRNFLGIVLPISVFLFAGYLWSGQGRESMIVLKQRADQAKSAEPHVPLASAMPDYVAARQAARREQTRNETAIDITLPNDQASLDAFVQPADGQSADESPGESPTTDTKDANDSDDSAPAAASADSRDTQFDKPEPAESSADVLPKPPTRNLWSRKSKTKVSRPHLLFVVIEDLNREDLGCYGQTLIRTPHIDKLALDGLRFTQFAGMSSGQTAQRTALLFGDLTMARAVGAERLIKLPQLSLPRMLSVSSYSTLLLGDCSWQLADDPEQGHWLHYWGWQPRSESSADRPDRSVEFSPRPAFASFDGARAPVGAASAGADTTFDQALLEQARRLTSECDPERPIALMVSLRLQWWTDLKAIAPAYASTDWTAAETLHASAVTAADNLVGELVNVMQSAADRGPIMTVLLGLPRERSGVELERFRASAPAVTRRGALAPDEATSLATSTTRVRPYGPPPAVVAHWPLAPAIIAWPEQIRAGESESGFTGYHDLLPTLASMIDARQKPLGHIMGSSHWNRWQVKD